MMFEYYLSGSRRKTRGKTQSHDVGGIETNKHKKEASQKYNCYEVG